MVGYATNPKNGNVVQGMMPVGYSGRAPIYAPVKTTAPPTQTAGAGAVAKAPLLQTPSVRPSPILGPINYPTPNYSQGAGGPNVGSLLAALAASRGGAGSFSFPSIGGQTNSIFPSGATASGLMPYFNMNIPGGAQTSAGQPSAVPGPQLKGGTYPGGGPGAGNTGPNGTVAGGAANGDPSSTVGQIGFGLGMAGLGPIGMALSALGTANNVNNGMSLSQASPPSLLGTIGHGLFGPSTPSNTPVGSEGGSVGGGIGGIGPGAVAPANAVSSGIGFGLSAPSSGAGGGGGGGGSGSVICTECARQGHLSEWVVAKDWAYGVRLRNKRPGVYEGYRIWAAPIVRMMKRSPRFTQLIAPLVRACAIELGRRADYERRLSAIGIFVSAGELFSLAVFYLRQKRRLELV